MEAKDNSIGASSKIEPTLSSQITTHSPSPFRFPRRLALLSGLLLWIAHPMPGLWPLAWIALAPLLVSVQEARNTRQAAFRGYLFGWTYLAPTCYWTGLTIVGWTGSQVGWVALLLLTAFCAQFYALWAAAAWRLARRTEGGWRVAGIAAAWVVMEWFRSAGSFSFPWAQVGYTQYRFLPVIQVSELTGALGVGFLIVLVNAAIVEWWRLRREANSGRWVGLSLGLAAIISVCGWVRMERLPAGRAVTVAVMQSNFDYRTGLLSARQKLDTFENLTEAAHRSASSEPELYVWAEGAAPGDAYNDFAARAALQRIANTHRGALLTGSRIVDASKETNSALLFTPASMMPQRFDKQALVPFGEYIPLRAQVPDGLRKQLQFFDTDITPGNTLSPMVYNAPAGPIAIGPFICYESVYPHYARMMTAGGATLLVTPSHDQWFLSEAAMEQHLAIAVFRAVENRRDIARPTTDGVSAIIDARGAVLARAPLRTASFLVHSLRLRSLITFYTRFGDWFVGVCALLFLTAYTHVEVRKRLAGSR